MMEPDLMPSSLSIPTIFHFRLYIVAAKDFATHFSWKRLQSMNARIEGKDDNLT